MSLDSIRANINKQFKGEVVGYGNCIPKFERIPFTSARLNYMTRGGLPLGACVEISGAEESGKTTLLADIVKNAQAMGLMCSFTDSENKTDLEYWKYLGVDLSNLLVCKPTGLTGEQILELQFELISQGIRLLGLDSVASLVPSAVFENSMEEKTYCGSSAIMSTFSQKLSGSGILYKHNATLIGINQVRDKIGGYTGGLSTPGGHFWKHACIARLQLSKSNPFDKNYKQLTLGATEDIAGHYIDVRMLKNQFCRNDRKLSTVAYCYADAVIGGVEDLLDVAMLYGIVVQGGAWYRIINPSTGELLCVNDQELKFQGRANIRNYLMNTPQIYKWLESQVNSMILQESSQLGGVGEEIHEEDEEYSNEEE